MIFTKITNTKKHPPIIIIWFQNKIIIYAFYYIHPAHRFSRIQPAFKSKCTAFELIRMLKDITLNPALTFCKNYSSTKIWQLELQRVKRSPQSIHFQNCTHLINQYIPYHPSKTWHHLPNSKPFPQSLRSNAKDAISPGY